MKHKKLLLLLSLCMSAHTNPLHENTLKHINNTIAACNDTAHAYHIKRFMEMQKHVVQKTSNNVDYAMQNLCNTMHTMHFRSVANAALAYLQSIGLADESAIHNIHNLSSEEDKWIAIIGHQTASLFEDKTLINEFLAKVADIKTRHESLALITKFAYTLHEEMSDDARSLLTRYTDTAQNGIVMIQSITDDEAAALINAIHETEGFDIRVASMLELYLDYRHKVFEKKERVESCLAQWCMNGFMAGLWTLASGALLAKILMDNNSWIRFYRDELPKCNTDICPGAFSAEYVYQDYMNTNKEFKWTSNNAIQVTFTPAQFGNNDPTTFPPITLHGNFASVPHFPNGTIPEAFLISGALKIDTTNINPFFLDLLLPSTTFAHHFSELSASDATSVPITKHSYITSGPTCLFHKDSITCFSNAVNVTVPTCDKGVLVVDGKCANIHGKTSYDRGRIIGTAKCPQNFNLISTAHKHSLCVEKKHSATPLSVAANLETHNVHITTLISYANNCTDGNTTYKALGSKIDRISPCGNYSGILFKDYETGTKSDSYSYSFSKLATQSASDSGSVNVSDSHSSSLNFSKSDSASSSVSDLYSSSLSSTSSNSASSSARKSTSYSDSLSSLRFSRSSSSSASANISDSYSSSLSFSRSSSSSASANTSDSYSISNSYSGSLSFSRSNSASKSRSYSNSLSSLSFSSSDSSSSSKSLSYSDSLSFSKSGSSSASKSRSYSNSPSSLSFSSSDSSSASKSRSYSSSLSSLSFSSSANISDSYSGSLSFSSSGSGSASKSRSYSSSLKFSSSKSPQFYIDGYSKVQPTNVVDNILQNIQFAYPINTILATLTWDVLWRTSNEFVCDSNHGIVFTRTQRFTSTTPITVSVVSYVSDIVESFTPDSFYIYGSGSWLAISLFENIMQISDGITPEMKYSREAMCSNTGAVALCQDNKPLCVDASGVITTTTPTCPTNNLCGNTIIGNPFILKCVMGSAICKSDSSHQLCVSYGTYPENLACGNLVFLSKRL